MLDARHSMTCITPPVDRGPPGALSSPARDGALRRGPRPEVLTHRSATGRRAAGVGFALHPRAVGGEGGRRDVGAAVAAFLAGGLEWLDIVEIDAAVVGEHEGLTGPGLDDVLAVETWARTRADELIAARNGGTHS